MVAVAMKMVAVVAIAMFVKYQVIMGGVGATEGISSVAMQQAGLGVILTVLLIATPPIAAMFFSVTLANFSAYSQFGQGQARDNAGNPVGSGATTSVPRISAGENESASIDRRLVRTS